MNQNRNHLVPTTVTNKNGVPTTVYKKPITTKVSGTVLPKTMLPVPTKTREQLENETAEALLDSEHGSSPTGMEAKIRDHKHKRLLDILPQYNDATLNRVIQAAGSTIQKLGILLRNSQPEEEYLNDWITLAPVSRSMKIDPPAYIVNSLGEYQNLEPSNNSHYPTRRSQQVLAIARVTEHFRTLGDGFNEDLNSNGKLMQIIADEELRNLLTTHEDPTAIADIIITRNLTDPDQIEALYEAMGATANAINDGTL